MMRKLLNHYKMVYFDASETLLTVPGAELVLQKFLSHRSLTRDATVINELFTEAFRLFYYSKQPEPFTACSPESDRMFWVNLYKYVLQKLGVDEAWSIDEVHDCCHELYDMYMAPEQYELFEDVRESLQLMQQMGLRLGIVSNFAPTLKEILRSKGILAFFDPVIVSTEVGLEKPDPAIFELAISRSGLSAEDLLYIGDHDLNDIWAPKQVGIDAIQILRYDHLKGKGIRSLRELFP
ncbi:HAD-IA family hydrolase [Paenibacillus eucommiae]|uniref:Hydrolase of the HAD superfamily n=1 Tax=Paenibacillus eucommiae TaxID=1355755 RepID=A0ABS4IYU1_9BACL|nr:HAD-IA family hydrolase [Paenibacillus eucommiae]MBP1992036.1 putative hydrolase of the HAD superfamily [Paenibacillus eucommiae]